MYQLAIDVENRYYNSCLSISHHWMGKFGNMYYVTFIPLQRLIFLPCKILNILNTITLSFSRFGGLLG